MALTKITSRILDSSGVTILGTIATGVWQGTAINQTYLVGQSGTNTGDETLARINALNVTELGTISSGVWNGTAIASAYLDADTAHLSTTQTFTGAKTFSSGGIFSSSSQGKLKLVAGSNEYLSLEFANASGTTQWEISKNNTHDLYFYKGGYRMMLKANGNVGIGNTNPAVPLDITSNSGANAIRIRARTQNDYGYMSFYNNAGTAYWGEIYYTGSSTAGSSLNFTVGSGLPKLAISSGGNVGIGVTPKASSSNWQHFQMGGTGNIITRQADTVAGTMYSDNFYIDENNADKRLVQAGASMFSADGGTAKIKVAGSAAANSTISWTNALTISSTGKAEFRSDQGAGNAQISARSNSSTNVNYGGIAIGQNSGGRGGYVTMGDTSATNNYYYEANTFTLAATANAGLKLRAFASNTRGITIGSSWASDLDAYEEGVFTPKFSGGGNGPDLGSNYSYQIGQFTRIGNMVFYIIDMSASINTATYGFLSITGLPFTSASGSSYHTATHRNCTALTINSGHDVKFWQNAGYNYIYIQADPLTTGSSYSPSSWDSSGRINISGMYRV